MNSEQIYMIGQLVRKRADFPKIIRINKMGHDDETMGHVYHAVRQKFGRSNI